MKTSLKIVVGACVLALFVGMAAAQDDNSVTKMSTLKLGPLPVTPACTTLAPTHGDPFKGAAVIAIKMTTGCKIPWHWHTANEHLMIVSGHGKVEMRDHNMSESVGPGDYVFLSGKHIHQFTCVAACTFYDVTDAAFDIHYVDKDGKEIKPEDALKTAAKPATPKAAPKK